MERKRVLFGAFLLAFGFYLPHSVYYAIPVAFIPILYFFTFGSVIMFREELRAGFESLAIRRTRIQF